MVPYVEPLDLAHVESGMAGEAAQYLFRMWRENNGILVQDQRLNRLSPQLMTLKPEALPGDVPEISFLGGDTPFRRYFPEAGSEDSQPTSLLPEGYRSGIAQGYHAAIAGEPWYDLQRTGGALGEGKPDLLLERLILRFRTNGGYERLFCLTTERRSCGRSIQSDRRRHLLNFQRKSGWHPAYQAAAVPSEWHETPPV